MRIGENIQALQAYNSMSQASRQINLASLRLSSGLKINSAADDAAGLAIANKLRLQVHGIEKASQNSSQGVSMIQTAEGAMTEIHNMLQRIRELAVKAANDTNEEPDRKKMQDEIDQLIEEINDIPQKTEYNKIKLLNGECDRIIRPSANVSVLRMSDTTPYGLLEFTVNTLGSPATVVAGPSLPLPNPALEGKTLQINGRNIEVSGTDTAAIIYNRINTALNAEPSLQVSVTPGSGTNVLGTLASMESGSSQSLTITGDPALLAHLGLSPVTTYGTDATVSINSGFDPLTATYTTQGNRITITDRNNVEVCLDINPNTTAGSRQGIFTQTGPLNLQVGANKNTNMYITIPKLNAETIEVSKANVNSRETASNTIGLVDKSIAIVSSVRSKLGAYQNRLEHTISNLDNAFIDSSQSLSRVEDTDMAMEMANYSKNNVVYQAGVAILAQANARPQSILQLLQ